MAEIYYPNDINFKIQFYNEDYNYFMVDNLLDNNFMKYFLTKHYSNEINKYQIKDIHNYEKIYIIDQNADFVNVNRYQAILIHNSNIEIIELPSFSDKISDNIQFDNDSYITDTESNHEDSESNDADNENDTECVETNTNYENIQEEENENEPIQEEKDETSIESNRDSFVNVEETNEFVNNLSSYVNIDEEISNE
jgi:hypothetical protein